MRREARLRLLGAKNGLILDNAKLEQIWYVLRDYVGVSNEAPEPDRLNYDEFCQAAAACHDTFGLVMDTFFRPSTFLRLPRDGQGTISLLSLFNYIMRRNAMLQTRVHLSCFDEDGEGWLTEEQLQSYITQLVPELPGLQELSRHMDLTTYSRIAVRKFLILHSKRGRMRIRDLLPSAAMAELLELRLAPTSEDGSTLGQPGNWFSLPSVLHVISQFQNADIDGNGQLSALEFAGFGGGTMTPLFISRLFEEHASDKRRQNSGGEMDCEMDFAAFLDFVLAWDHRSTAAGLQYFFPILDLQGRGYITQVDIYALLKEIYAMWLMCGQYKELSIEDVKDEIFDIVQPSDPLRIAAKDLAACGMAGTIVSMLADVNLFWEYDMRETLLQPEEAEGGAIIGAVTM